MRLKDCVEYIAEKDLDKFCQKNNIKYVALQTEEPLTGLCFDEIEEILDTVTFSLNEKQNKTIQVIILMHCYGFSDNQIANGLNIIRKKKIGRTGVFNARKKALEQIEKQYGTQIGLITILREAFK